MRRETQSADRVSAVKTLDDAVMTGAALRSVVPDSFATPWTAAYQVPLSMGFPRQEYWSGLPSPPPEDLPDPAIKPVSSALAGGFFTTEPPGKPTLCGLGPALKKKGSF